MFPQPGHAATELSFSHTPFWPRQVTSPLSLSFLICKVGTVTAHVIELRGCSEVMWLPRLAQRLLCYGIFIIFLRSFLLPFFFLLFYPPSKHSPRTQFLAQRVNLICCLSASFSIKQFGGAERKCVIFLHISLQRLYLEVDFCSWLSSNSLAVSLLFRRPRFPASDPPVTSYLTAGELPSL